MPYRRPHRFSRPRPSGPPRHRQVYSLVVNQAAGGSVDTAVKLARKLERRFRRGECDCIVESASDWAGFTRLVTESARKHPHALVVFGGDGSVRMAASQVARNKGLLGIVPCGRFNNIFSSLYGHVDPEMALEIVRTGREMRIDAATANGQFIVGSLVSGLIPALLERLGKSSLPRLSLSWSKLAARAAEDTVATPITMKVDAFTFTAEPLILNVHLLPNLLTLRMAPAAAPQDGRLIIVVDTSGDRDTAAHYIRDLRKRKYQYSESIQMIRGQRVTIAPASGRQWLMDGDPVVFSGSEVTVEVIPQAVRVFAHVPPKV